MVCFTIIFLSLLECIIVDRLWRANAKKVEDEKKSGSINKRKSKVGKVENKYNLRNACKSTTQSDRQLPANPSTIGQLVRMFVVLPPSISPSMSVGQPVSPRRSVSQSVN